MDYSITVLYDIWRHILLYIASNVSKENTATVFRIPFYKREVV